MQIYIAREDNSPRAQDKIMELKMLRRHVMRVREAFLSTLGGERLN